MKNERTRHNTHPQHCKQQPHIANQLKRPRNPYAKTKSNETASTATASPAAPKTHHAASTIQQTLRLF
jgi:hypothetical protein